ncbi:coenzyme F420-0:L-glutamate ligase [Natranaerobius trueperi]|uniref:F420-0--gamma-glutamyl ligase n=1 Tax=Natranaerobius trueperi TaxID=759412 RepID=A0A226C0K8_9FIRM|nr:F420-0--gamma-glutamyl ligase [Natranaerobius trueperi]OWZ84711.1 F420-0--gamma-glutamyl ligase [Natranaerobius trueperi]
MSYNSYNNVKTNPSKPINVTISKKQYARYPIKTHFVTTEDNYIDVISEYAKPIYEKGDILAISEKVIAVTQERIIKKEEMKVIPFAKFLSRFVHVSSAGQSVGNPHKMQVAINRAGIFRILIASFVAAITRPFGIKGLFYKIVGNDVWALDGFNDLAYDYYGDKGILSPKNPQQVCDHIKQETGINAVVADANDLNIDIMGKSADIELDDDTIKEIIKDNPAGQKDEQTPLILIREL